MITCVMHVVYDYYMSAHLIEENLEQGYVHRKQIFQAVLSWLTVPRRLLSQKHLYSFAETFNCGGGVLVKNNM